MSELHHSRLVIGLEISQPGSRRVLDREQADQLAALIAVDLARIVPGVESSMLVMGGTLLEPNELIRPGFPAWQALDELAARATRGQPFSPRILAVGAHAGRMPDGRLDPPEQPPHGQFLALPLLVISQHCAGERLQTSFEQVLFEKGGIDPPVRACLSENIGLQSVHGQLLTLADLVALQQVQLDSAGLGGFWPVVEHALLASEDGQQFDLPGGLEADWRDGALKIDFHSFNQFSGDVDDYALWLRAFRTLTALLDAHSVNWHARERAPVVADSELSLMIEAEGPVDHADSLTRHLHPEVGLIAWSVVEEGRLINLYPLTAEAASRLQADLARRGLPEAQHVGLASTDAETGRLKPGDPQ